MMECNLDLVWLEMVIGLDVSLYVMMVSDVTICYWGIIYVLVYCIYE